MGVTRPAHPVRSDGVDVGGGEWRRAVERDEQDLGPGAITIGVEIELAVVCVVKKPGVGAPCSRVAARIEIH